MKKLFFTVALMATSLVASAQFATSNGGGSFSAAKTSAEVSEHGSFYVQYNSFGVGDLADVLDDMDAESDKLTGLTVGFNKAISVTPSLPLFVEVGAGLTYAWAKLYDEEDTGDCPFCGDEYSESAKMSSQHLMVNVPVNMMYKFQVPNTSIVLEPYVGLNVKAHLMGQMKTKATYEACCDDMEEFHEDYLEEVEDDMTSNYFDKDDMGGKKYVAKRVNIGWQIGANVDFGSAFVGVSYGSDFGKFMKLYSEDWTFSATNITVGLRF